MPKLGPHLARKGSARMDVSFFCSFGDKVQTSKTVQQRRNQSTKGDWFM